MAQISWPWVKKGHNLLTSFFIKVITWHKYQLKIMWCEFWELRNKHKSWLLILHGQWIPFLYVCFFYSLMKANFLFETLETFLHLFGQWGIYGNCLCATKRILLAFISMIKKMLRHIWVLHLFSLLKSSLLTYISFVYINRTKSTLNSLFEVMKELPDSFSTKSK